MRLPEAQPRLRRPAIRFAPEPLIAETQARALDLLATQGVEVDDVSARDLLAAIGVPIVAGRARPGRDWIETQLALAPATFTWVARRRERSVVIGADALAFGLHAQARAVLGADTGLRPAAMTDLQNALKLGQVFGAIHVIGQPFTALSDVPQRQLPLVALQAALTLTDKPLIVPLVDADTAADQLALAAAALGPLDALPGPALLGEAAASAPLTWDAATCAALVAFARSGQAVLVRPSGGRAGQPDAAARQQAEILFAAALAQAARPGTPVVHGGLGAAQPSTTATVRGALGLGLARLCGLPGALDAAPSESAAGAAAMTQSGSALWPGILGGAALVASAAGTLSAGTVFSFEQLLADVDGLAMFRHFLAGFVVDDETLALDAIAVAGPGGHHLDTAHTRARFADAFYPSFLADRLAYETWELAGSWDAARRAEALLPELLGAHTPPALDPTAGSALQDTLARRLARLQT